MSSSRPTTPATWRAGSRRTLASSTDWCRTFSTWTGSRRSACRDPRDDLRTVPARTERAPALPRRRCGTHAGAAVRRASRRARMDRRARRRRRFVPDLPPRRAAAGRASGGGCDLAGWLRNHTAAQAATTGWSTAAGPTCAAPPGDPRPLTASPNHSALIGVNCFHSAGTSSS